MKYKDYYKILGVDKNASQDEIKKAYRKLAKKYHPDINKGNKTAENRFKDVSEAYEVLGDTEKRKKYDQFGSRGDFYSGMDFDPSQYGFGNKNVKYEYYTSDNMNGFSDFFNMFFGGRRKSSVFDDIFSGFDNTTKGFSSKPVKGQDAEAEIEVYPYEAFNGVKKKISLNLDGKKKSITFSIPKGITDGKKIKLSGQGHPGPGKNGDLYLKIKFKNTKDMRIDGLNITQNLKVLPWEAALGGKANVHTLHGKLLVNIPKGIKTGNKIKVKEKGYRDTKGNIGDLYLEIQIVNPPVLNYEQIELYKKLKEITKYNPRE